MAAVEYDNDLVRGKVLLRWRSLARMTEWRKSMQPGDSNAVNNGQQVSNEPSTVQPVLQ
jgi:heme-degrading monooxygenase HmoA